MGHLNRRQDRFVHLTLDDLQALHRQWPVPCQNRIGSPFAHKAKLFAINMIGNIKLDGAMHLTAESKLGIFRCGNNARGSVTQRIGTSLTLFPIEETIPIPVMATRRMIFKLLQG